MKTPQSAVLNQSTMLFIAALKNKQLIKYELYIYEKIMNIH